METTKSIISGKTPVLLVEGVGELRDTIAEALQDAGYEVVIAKDGEEALQILKADRARTYILITDITLPNKKGDEVIVEAKRQGIVFLQIIIISVPEHVGIGVVKLIKSGEARYLQKPFAMDMLLQMITSKRREWN